MTERSLTDVALAGWSLVYDAYEPDAETKREALCTLGNGRFATRGASSDALGSGPSHYPGCYAAGLYDRLSTEVQDKSVVYEELVNLPNWLPVLFSIDGDPPISIAHCERVSFRQELDMAHGMLRRAVRLRDRVGRITRIVERRIVHMADPRLAAQHITLEPENWTGTLRVVAWIDGAVENRNADEYDGLDRRHFDGFEKHGDGATRAALRGRTRQSRIEVVLATRTRVVCGAAEAKPTRADGVDEPARIGLAHELACGPGERIEVEKILALTTSRDPTVGDPLDEAFRSLAAAPSFDALCVPHVHAWQRSWQRFDLVLPRYARTTTILRFHAFHLLQSYSPASTDLDVGIPARGLHGENYHGHIFWDELFVFPILSLRWCELTRGLLRYRYRRLRAARQRARALGLAGALFPWRSASDGHEVTDNYRKNIRTGRFIPDHSHLQRHIQAAIVYDVWQYFRVTGDREFLINYGAELVLSIARFWSSAAEFDEADGRYHLRGVVGPDEFHDAYPDAAAPGIDDNAYTNLMAVWCLLRAQEVLTLLPSSEASSLRACLAIDDAELARWDDISRKMAVYFIDGDILSQFRGFDALAPLSFDAYRMRYGDIHRLDDILDAEGDTPNRYQVCKQADVLMLFYLLSEAQVRALLSRLGYAFDGDAFARNVHYYQARTTHGSTLSRVVHAWVLTRLDRAGSWSVLKEALGSDLADIQGSSTREGIHVGAMAGAIDVFQRAYLGLDVCDDTLVLDPQLPAELASMRLCIRYRGHALDIHVDCEALRITTEENGASVTVRIAGRTHTLAPGQLHRFSLAAPARAACTRGG